MGACLFTDAIKSNCNDLIKSGGAKRKFWIGNRDDLDASMGAGGYVLDVNGNITQLYFKPYKGLYEFETKKNVVSAGFEMQKGEGTNVFNQTVTAKIFKETAQAYETMKDLSVADVFIIIETNSNQFKVFGIDSGLEVTAMTQNTGNTPQSDTSISVTFSGADDDLPRFFFDTSYANTLSLLQSYVIV